MAHWSIKKVVVRDFYISFKHMGSHPNGKTIDLSDTTTNQASDEAVYVAVTGYPDLPHICSLLISEVW
jgi:hypothetical protein